MQFEIVGASAAAEALRQEVATAARSDAKVLITGESGCGKEIVARLIHRASVRCVRPMVPINCAGVPESLLESALFGHVRGSFTDAHRDRRGLLEAAHGGTVLLDEIGDVSARMQGLLLRFLESGEIQRVGDPAPSMQVDARVIAATNRDLRARITHGEFRLDLFYRLNVIHLHVPPLRHRRDDVLVLLNHFMCRFAQQYAVTRPVLSSRAIDMLVGYDWPGNVRELQNAAERLVIAWDARAADLDPVVQRMLSVAAVARGAEQESDEEPLFADIVSGRASFWSAVADPFMARDLARAQVIAIVRRGLAEARGSYHQLAVLFHLQAPGEDKRLVAFLKKHRCFVPLGPLRATA